MLLLLPLHNTDMQYVMNVHTIISRSANACAPCYVLRKCTTQACEGECNALRDECRAISEDLEVLVKENQVVNHQLTTAVTERYAADQRFLLLVYIMHDVSTKHVACMDLKVDCVIGQHGIRQYPECFILLGCWELCTCAC